MGAVIGNTFGTLSSAPDNVIVNCIYGYVASILPELKANSDENENTITNRLCKTLSSRKPSEYPFYFQHQNLEDGNDNTSTDFAVFGTCLYAQEMGIESDSPSLIKFEAKRLDSRLPTKRKKEYVCGEYADGRCLKDSGGIERFKKGIHGKDVSNVGIVGYIQTDSSSIWFENINSWIKEQIESPSDSRLTWQDCDLLTIDNQNSFLTIHSSASSRISGDKINLRHFWIDISKLPN